MPGLENLFGRQADFSGHLPTAVVVARQVKNLFFGHGGRIVNHHMHQEPVELGFRQGVGAFLFDGVLGGHYHEQAIQREGAHADTDLAFAHGFE